ncbi:MAG: hypothetical protein MJ025_06695 [Victivallaceae bacterium]|nr:hypothetical protein [Victivallaceae bacterium]
MGEMTGYIRDYAEEEPIPEWIEKYVPGARVNKRDVLGKSRTFLYPGAAFDSMPIKLMSETRCWHLLIYVDDLVYKNRELLVNASGLSLQVRGYDVIGSFDFDEHSVVFVFERQEMSPAWLAEQFGPKRFAMMFVDDDATATFKRLTSLDPDWNPHTMLLSFDMMITNDKFGRGSDFEKTVMEAPPLFLIYDDDRGVPWSRYKDVGANPMYGGMNDTKRVLYELKL